MKLEGGPTPTPPHNPDIITAQYGAWSIFARNTTTFDIASLAKISGAKGSHIILTNCPTGKIDEGKLVVKPGQLCYGRFVSEPIPQMATNTITPSQKDVVVIASTQSNEGDWVWSLCCLVPIGLAVVAVVLSRWSRPKNESQQRNGSAIWDGSLAPATSAAEAAATMRVSAPGPIKVVDAHVESYGDGKVVISHPTRASVQRTASNAYMEETITDVAEARPGWGDNIDITMQTFTNPNPVPCQPVERPLAPEVREAIIQAASERAAQIRDDFNNFDPADAYN